MTPLSAPRSAVDIRDFGSSAMAGPVGRWFGFPASGPCHPQTGISTGDRRPIWIATARRTVFHLRRAARVFKNPGRRMALSRHPPMPHRRARRLMMGYEREVGPTAPRSPHIAGGEPFSADPGDEVLRLTPNARAGPASPERLAVYPQRNGAIVGPGREGGNERG